MLLLFVFKSMLFVYTSEEAIVHTHIVKQNRIAERNGMENICKQKPNTSHVRACAYVCPYLYSNIFLHWYVYLNSTFVCVHV